MSTFLLSYVVPVKGEDFAKFCGLLRIYELEKASSLHQLIRLSTYFKISTQPDLKCLCQTAK